MQQRHLNDDLCEDRQSYFSFQGYDTVKLIKWEYRHLGNTQTSTLDVVEAVGQESTKQVK